MKNAKLPSNSEMKDIRKSVSKKLNQIYEPVKDEYDVTIGEEELVFMRLADGRCALQFTYENLLDAKDGSQKGLHDQAKLIVFVE